MLSVFITVDHGEGIPYSQPRKAAFLKSLLCYHNFIYLFRVSALYPFSCRPCHLIPVGIVRPHEAYIYRIVGGIAAALGITALLSLLGINGAGISSLITGLLLAVVVFFVVRMFLMRRRPQTAGGPAGSNQFDQQRQTDMEQTMQRESNSAPQQNWQQSQGGVRSGSLMDQLMGGAASESSSTAESSGLVDVTPVDFDREGFLKTARDNYLKLQQAWDTGNVIEISDFTSNEIFTAVTHQLRERKGEVYHTEVKSLENELLGIAQQDGTYYASVRFFGSLVVSGEPETFDEIWVLEKPVTGTGGWLLCAIRQNESSAQA